jgi:hypothetical protein
MDAYEEGPSWHQLVAKLPSSFAVHEPHPKEQITYSCRGIESLSHIPWLVLALGTTNIKLVHLLRHGEIIAIGEVESISLECPI